MDSTNQNQNENEHENVVYNIKDDGSNREVFDINNYILTNDKVNVILSDNYINTDINNYIDDLQLELFYKFNYTTKMLERALEYYNIKKKKGMKKDDMIQSLVIFECDIENAYKVQRRHTLLKYIEELKEDCYFKNFVIF